MFVIHFTCLDAVAAVVVLFIVVAQEKLLAGWLADNIVAIALACCSVLMGLVPRYLGFVTNRRLACYLQQLGRLLVVVLLFLLLFWHSSRCENVRQRKIGKKQRNL